MNNIIQECMECNLEEEIKKQICSICITQKIIRGKWKLVILWLLKDEKKRFSQIKRELTNIKQGSLTQQLRELEGDGLIHREVYKVVPPKVEYSLTNSGKEFLSVMNSMELWGSKYIKSAMEQYC